MRWTNWLLAVVLLDAMTEVQGWAQPRRLDTPAGGLSIYIHNFSGLPDATVEAAARDAEEIFRQAGLGVRVSIDRMAMQNGELKPVTRFSPQPTDLVANILSREMAASLPVGRDVLGVAPGAEQKNRNVVYVFAHRVQQLSQLSVRTVRGGGPAWIASESRVLAYALVHEIGHLLLNSAGHPESGIMRGNWRYSELQAIAARTLHFSKDETARLRQAAQQRVQLAAEFAERAERAE